MLLDTIFSRTRKGAAAMNDKSVPLSPGFRNILSMINGKRNGRALLEAMPQLDEEDLSQWCGELVRQGLIAPKGDLLPEEAAFSLTTEMPLHFHDTSMDAGPETNDIIADIERSLEPPLSQGAAKKLSSSARMRLIKSAGSHPAMKQNGFFVYSDAAPALLAAPQVWIATHEPALAKLLGLLVKGIGATTKVMATRQTLLEQLRSTPLRADVLFLDADMPEIDGFRALETIRTAPSLMGIRVVLISARSDRVDLARAMMQGAAGYIIKPLKREVMEAAMSQLFGKSTKPAQ